jgi:hypothetical protein
MPKRLIVFIMIIVFVCGAVIIFLKFNPNILKSKDELLTQMNTLSKQKEIEFINCDIVDKENYTIKTVNLTTESRQEILNLGVQDFRDINSFDNYINNYKGKINQDKVFEIMNLFDENYFKDHSIIIIPYKTYKNKFLIDIIKNIELKDNKIQINKIFYSFDDLEENTDEISILILPINDNQIKFDGITIKSDYSKDTNLVNDYLELYKLYKIKEKIN